MGSVNGDWKRNNCLYLFCRNGERWPPGGAVAKPGSPDRGSAPAVSTSYLLNLYMFVMMWFWWKYKLRTLPHVHWNSQACF